MINSFLPTQKQSSFILEESLPSGKKFTLDLNLDYPSYLPQMQRVSEKILLSGGKRLRPKICFLVGDGLGISFEKMQVYARAAELVHSATLSHDDVLDQAIERRNRPTLNQVLTQARAVLTGDLLLSRVMVELSQAGDLQILKRMAEVLENLVMGEWIQLEARGKIEIEESLLRNIAYLKTASLMEWCFETPFRIANQNETSIALARMVGKHLGLAFQAIDDTIDFSTTSGKEFCKDLREGMMNQVTLILLRENPNLKLYFNQVMKDAQVMEWGKHVSHEALEFAVQEVRNIALKEIKIVKNNLINLKQVLNPMAIHSLHELMDQLLRRSR